MAMKVFDSHLHFFNTTIIDNVSRRNKLVAFLGLQSQGALERLGPGPLADSMRQAGVVGGLALPTAAAADVDRINSAFLKMVAAAQGLCTAGTLHPDGDDTGEQLQHLYRHGVRAIKLCSFSQGFVLDGPKALALFDRIEAHNHDGAAPFFVVLDTFFHAHRYFGTDPAHTTTPAQVTAMARRCPHTVFIAAHMGGLSAPFDTLWSDLIPSPNLVLDTSNAAHTLTREQFVAMLKRFGPHHVVFGTDWPWFTHQAEIARIGELTDAAGFSTRQKGAVFHDTIAALLGL